VFPRRSIGWREDGTSEPDLFGVELSPREDMLRRFRISRQDMMTVNITVGSRFIGRKLRGTFAKMITFVKFIEKIVAK